MDHIDLYVNPEINQTFNTSKNTRRIGLLINKLKTCESIYDLQEFILKKLLFMW